MRSISVFANFQGSVSARYLFPILAKFIASFKASLNLNCSKLDSTEAFISLNSFIVSISYSVSSPLAGTFPSKYFPVSTIALLIKLPNIATNSLLFLVWKSSHVKSLSLVSGALAVSTYLRTSCLPGKSFKYSWSHTAQLRDVDILSPSKFKNSLAGTLSGRI